MFLMQSKEISLNPNFAIETDSRLSRGKILCKSLLGDVSSEEIFSVAKLGLNDQHGH